MTKTDPHSLAISPVTKLINAGIDRDKAHRSVMPPLYLSTNFSFESLDAKPDYDYARRNHPGRETLAGILADLEGGVGAVMTTSGLAALDLLWQDLGPNAHVIAPYDCYGGTQRLLNARHAQGLIRVSYVDMSDETAFDRLMDEKPKLVLIETPSNPLMRVYDLSMLIHKAHNAQALVAVDNTFLSPVLQNPIAFGADFVAHSTTKYINGHSDVIGGALVFAHQDHVEKYRWWANAVGSTQTAFDTYLTFRGVKTLFVRVHEQDQSARKIAAFLDDHKTVAKVHYPGLTSHPQHGLAKKQQKGFGGMMSFELKGGFDAVRSLCERIQLFTLAESLGGVESLIAHPATMTHAAMSPEALNLAGISPSLVRISTGLEDPQDLIKALDEALR
jgi:cystathionine gamma-synthase